MTPAPTTATKGARVCVIGAGLTGLVACKELRAAGVEVECYDMMPRLGGTFASYVWKGGRLTSSTVFTWFSDFPVEDRQHFMSWREFLDYLEAYVDHFGFRERLHLDCKALAAVREDDGGWRIRFRRADHSNGHPLHPKDRVVEEREFEERFTHLIVSTGLNHRPKIPDIPGLADFTGELLHSSEYRDAEDHRGRRVIVVGGGESGSDIAAQLAPVAAECTLSLRSAPGTMFPKWIQGNTPDIRDDRLTYNLPRMFAPVIRRGQRGFFRSQREHPELFEFAARMNFEHNRTPYTSNACKSFGIAEAVVHHGARLAPAIRELEGSRVRFRDGSEVEADLIVFATGFEIDFPLLEPALNAKFTAINQLWKNAVHPELGERLMVLGFARPQQINQLSTSEMQARMAALVISGRRRLPSPARMRETIAADRAFMRRNYGERYAANPALVDQLYFTEGLAKFIGCEVPWAEAFARDPKLGLHLLFAALSGAHHRLAGPGANWKQAAETIKATPLFRNKRNAVVRWTALSLFHAAGRTLAWAHPQARTITRQARP